jgi:SAM-dependent methyltransferase
MRNGCRICGSDGFDLFLELDRAPTSIERLLDEDAVQGDHPIPLTVWRCQTCSHVQTRSDLEDTFYDDYYMLEDSEIEEDVALRRAMAESFQKLLPLRGKRIVDIGCGDGSFLTVLKSYGADVTGIEPSTKTLPAIRARGFEPKNGYLDETSFPELSGQFDGLIAHQVLEHVPEPNSLLRGARRLLRSGGYVQMNVPSLGKAMNDLRFFDFFPDHTSYFSETSLPHLFARNYFDVIGVETIYGGNWLQIQARSRSLPDGTAMRGAADQFRSAFSSFVREEAAAARRTAVWGAGGKGVVAMAMADCPSIAYVIDSSKVKQGRYLPVSHLKVVSPGELLKDPVDTVIITCLSVTDEIVALLRTDLQFKGRIAALDGGKVTLLQDSKIDGPGL